MGVLPCDRVGCENIMCDRLSTQHGYICWECFDELVASGTLGVNGFMNTPKQLKRQFDQSFYEEVFPIMEGSPFFPE